MQAKQFAQDFTNARERYDNAVAASKAFLQTYQAAHMDLPNLMLTPDFQLAVTRTSQGLIGAVELTAEERRKAAALHRKFMESQPALEQAKKNWEDYQYQIVLDHHIPIAPGWGSDSVTLSTGKTVSIPKPWSTGLAFTPDFRFAVPYGF